MSKKVSPEILSTLRGIHLKLLRVMGTGSDLPDSIGNATSLLFEGIQKIVQKDKDFIYAYHRLSKSTVVCRYKVAVGTCVKYGRLYNEDGKCTEDRGTWYSSKEAAMDAAVFTYMDNFHTCVGELGYIKQLFLLKLGELTDSTRELPKMIDVSDGALVMQTDLTEEQKQEMSDSIKDLHKSFEGLLRKKPE